MHEINDTSAKHSKSAKCQSTPIRPSSVHPECSGEDHFEDTEVLPYFGQHSKRASLASSSLPAWVQDLLLRSKLSDRHRSGLPPRTLCRRFFKRWPSEPLLGESRGPRCPKSGYNSVWAARFLCFRVGHLELPTAGSSTNYEQCWTV